MNRVRAWLGIAGVLTAMPVVAALGRPMAGQTAPSDDAEFFEAKVRPVLVERCQGCHGAAARKGGLRLDTRNGVLRGAASGPLAAGGDPAQSRLVRAIGYAGAIKMPPGGKLPDSEIAALTEWVRRGMPWPALRDEGGGMRDEVAARALHPSSLIPHPSQWWSFQPVKRPAIPAVRDRSWVKNPIDAFVLARLERAGLRPAPPADRRTLLRRATYDLTGLPPTPAEVAAFLADNSPNAWDKVVDRLLSSPRYGERWGRHWLDVARYCDSLDSRGLGGEGDIADAWRYRDWVIDAFNRDMPYDQFVTNQIAGDLLPPPGIPSGNGPRDAERDINISGTIATGFLAIGNWGNGDADKDKILTDIADDQVDAVSRGFLGLTVACARCHDHKFDPITQNDYYGLAGIFFSTHILPKLTPKGAGETPLRIPLETRAEREARNKYAADLKGAEGALSAARDAAYADLARSLMPQAARYVMACWDYRDRPAGDAALTPEAFARAHELRGFALRQWRERLGMAGARPMTTAVREVQGNTAVSAWKGPEDTPSVTVNANDTARAILTFVLPPRSVAVHPGPASAVVVSWRSPVAATVSVRGGVVDGDPGGGDGIAWVLRLATRRKTELARGAFENGGAQRFDAGTGARRLTAVRVAAGDRIELAVLPKANHGFDTTVVDLTIATSDGRAWNLAADVVPDLLAGNPHADHFGNAGVWTFGEEPDPSKQTLPAGPPDLSRALARWRQVVESDGSRADAEAAAQAIARAFTAADKSSPFWIARPVDEGELPEAARANLAALTAALERVRAAAPPPVQYANGAQEGGVPESPHAGFHDVRVHIRGSYARLGDLAPRHFPVVLAGDHQPPITQGSGRLELARWIASPTNPLTARVIVNRVWQHHFGEGIVRTPSNFGALGERPTHPELLDWLASSFAATDDGRRTTEDRRQETGDRRGPRLPSTLNPQRSTVSVIRHPSSVGLGWSLKKLHRLILLSNTYRQSSHAADQAAALRVDPDDRLLSRFARRRLEAEEVRDSLLAAAGRLDTTMGGPAVRDFSAPRRSAYIMTIRSDRSGFGPLFDMADSTAQVDRRAVSTVAPQALFLLNDPFALAQARALARRLLAAAPADAARIGQAYQVLFARPPTAAEVRVGAAFLARARRRPAGPVAGAGAPDVELRAWTEYGQILLCSNEFMYLD